MPDVPDLAERDVRSIADGYLGREHEYEAIASELLRRRRENRDLRAENERMREAVDAMVVWQGAARNVTEMRRGRKRWEAAIAAIREADALAGSPAEKEEQ